MATKNLNLEWGWPGPMFGLLMWAGVMDSYHRNRQGSIMAALGQSWSQFCSLFLIKEF